RRPPPAGATARERGEVRGRRHAHLVRHVLGGRGSGRALAWLRRRHPGPGGPDRPRLDRGGRAPPPPTPGGGAATTRAIARLRAFAAFCYDCVVGDDPWVAAGVVLALAATAVLTSLGAPAWWLLPLATAALLAGSLRRAARRDR